MRAPERLTTLFLALLLCAGNALAQAYPNKAIRVVIGALAGDACDVLTRLIGAKMSKRLGQPLIVDNRPGASGTIGIALVAKAAPDGYTIACGQGGNMLCRSRACRKWRRRSWAAESMPLSRRSPERIRS